MIMKHGVPALGVIADIRDDAAVEQALRQAVERFGPIHVLVQGAAGNFLALAKDLSANGFKAVLDIDLSGTFRVMKRAYPHLLKPGASVLNSGAPQSVVPMRYQVHACAAKAGVDQITRVLALEWGPDGIRVNSISPGPIAGTEGARRLLPNGNERAKSLERGVPLGRLGTKTDVANLALFLASPFANHISGAIIPCDGDGDGDGDGGGGGGDGGRASLERAGVELARVRG